MRTLLANATVITMNPARDVLDADILIENGVIADMGPGLAGRPENAGAERVDLSGRIVIPGLIQSHMHVTQSLFRGLADEMELMDWLQRRIWPLEGAHTPETNAAAARLAAAEGLRSGVTAFIDMVRTPFSKPCATWGCAGCSASACSIWAARTFPPRSWRIPKPASAKANGS